MTKCNIKRYLIKLIILLLVFINIKMIDTYAFWYDEEVIEKKEDTSMWPKSKRKAYEEEWEKREKKYIRKWIYDVNDFSKYAKDGFYVIDEDNDNIGFNYYFDKNGKLIKDTITSDYRVVDKDGREVDSELKPIEYKILKNGKIVKVGDREDNYIEETIEEETTTVEVSREPAQVLIGKGVVFKSKNKVYDNSMDKNMFSYIDSSYKYSSDKKGKIYNGVQWNKCGLLNGNGAYVVFNNPKNNFNKVMMTIATGEEMNSSLYDTCNLLVYDANEYFSNKEDINPIYDTNEFNCNDGLKLSFTFDRDIEKLIFLIETNSNDDSYGGSISKSRKCYVKDMKYGFNKKAYEEFLIEKLDEQEEIERLKRLGIYYEDLEYLDEYIDEDGEIIEEEDSEYDEFDGRRYEDSDIFDDETEEYSSEDRIRDKYTGPNFDKDLKDIVDKRDIGPKVEE